MVLRPAMLARQNLVQLRIPLLNNVLSNGDMAVLSLKLVSWIIESDD